MRTISSAGDVATQSGSATHVYVVTRSMADEYFYNADGELLVVPEVGALRLFTEMGVIDIAPGEIALLPRGIKFTVELRGDQAARGYVCENYGAKLTCPERGPIGANCLANRRDFLTPVAAYEEKDGARCRIVVKWCGGFHAAEIDHSPLDVVAWHGNYAPYKYNLRHYAPVGPILKDHADPSIFTVLTAPSEMPGTANIDFVIFPPRWLVAEDTFRPPWFHRNVMSELMGLVRGVYDAKARLSELVDRAESGLPTTITKRGRVVARIVPARAPRWDRAAVLDEAEAFRRRVALKGKVDIRALIERGRR